jgi:hypothetical protein
MRSFRPRLTYANVVSTLCLFLVLGGGAWAATKLPKNSVGTKQLKANAVTGAKVKDGSLTGADIAAQTLGKVPQAGTAETATSAGHATSADSAGHAGTAGSADHAATATSADHATSADAAATAGDAATLDGNGPGAFYAAGGIKRIDATPAYKGAAETVYSAGGLELTAACAEGGVPTLTDLSIFATSSAAGARIASGYVEKFGSTEKPVIDESGLDSMPTEVWATVGSSGGSFGEGVGSLLYTDAERSIVITLQTQVTTGRECELSGTAVVNG